MVAGVAAGRDLDVRATLATAPATGDPRLLERLIANLLGNAIRHNTPGGDVEITTGTRDRHAFLAIGNTGPVVPPEDIERLFQPFARLNGARTGHNSGHGLGLSIEGFEDPFALIGGDSRPVVGHRRGWTVRCLYDFDHDRVSDRERVVEQVADGAK